LKQRDDQVKVRAYVRAQNLDTRANSNYNVLTGSVEMIYFLGEQRIQVD